MHLVNADRRAVMVASCAISHPLVIRPIEIERPDDGSCLRRHLVSKAEGIGLVDFVIALRGDDVILVSFAPGDSGNQPLPNARPAARSERVCARPPAIE